jgi:tyrosyl-tRNA synthetase
MIFEELEERGLIAQTTNREKVKELINKGGAKFYIGFDPTADSLHVGHFMALCLMKRLQEAGNIPIVLIGGGTASIGDPSGRSDMRQMLTPFEINNNVECFKKQISKFISFKDKEGYLVNNADWLLNLNFIEVMRDIGACFSVNNMLRAECYKQRMEKGLSLLEFMYMPMQAYDFYFLNKQYDVNLQFGGDDQWSNMLAGETLVRKKTGKDVFSLTIPLLLNSEGKKMGKTAKGAVWLDPDKTSPFEFYQYWRNVDDGDVIKCLKMLTFIHMDRIKEMETWQGKDVNRAKEILAYELTNMVHGKENAEKVQQAVAQLFSNSGNTEEMPTTEINASTSILDILVMINMANSKSEAKKLIKQGGISIDGVKISATDTIITLDKVEDGIVIKKGKKTFHKIKACGVSPSFCSNS